MLAEQGLVPRLPCINYSHLRLLRSQVFKTLPCVPQLTIHFHIHLHRLELIHRPQLHRPRPHLFKPSC